MFNSCFQKSVRLSAINTMLSCKKYLLQRKVRTQQTFVGPQDMPWRHRQHVFSVTILRLRRRLEDVFKTSRKTPWRDLQDVFKTSWKRKNCYAEDVFKTSWREKKFLRVVSLSNKSKCVSKKALFHKLYLRNLRRIQNASLRS